MSYFLLLTTLILSCAVAALATLECHDWQGKTVPDGIEFYPKKEDPCYMCQCDKGSSTMCKTVSCAPPNCANWQKLSGCCQFECLDGPGGSGDNSTGPTHGVTGSPTDHTMSDLGLRLVASTVTTFLILALLLFLIHRLRQRRLLVSLRRYNRRRERFEDEDNVSYPPEYFGIPCPPYEDPPPPYSPPKPHIHHGELPPPYETINRDGNLPQFDGNSQNPVRNQSGTTSYICESQSAAINSNTALSSAITNAVDETESSGTATLGNERFKNRISNMSDTASIVQLRNSGALPNGNNSRPSVPSTISTNIHHRNSLNSPNSAQASANNNSFSSVQHVVTPKELPSPIVLGTAVLCMAHVAQNADLQVSDCRSDSQANEADIESSESSGDCSPDSLELESEQKLKKGNFSPRKNSSKLNSNQQSDNTTEGLSQDAETTVKQFLDRQFGPLSKVRHYPTTMSQSWTSSMFTSTMPNPGEPVLPQCRETSSVGSFKERISLEQGKELAGRKVKSSGGVESRGPKPTSGIISRARLFADDVREVELTRTTPVNTAARVSYVEAEDFSTTNVGVKFGAENNLPSSQCSNHASEETDTNYSLNTQSLDSPAVSQIGDAPNESQRQDVLRELRLSHLLYSPPSSFENTASPTSPPRLSEVFQMQRSQSMNSDNSTFSVCSETGEKRLGGRISGVAISNDAPYPENSYRNFLRSSLLPQSSNEETNVNQPNTDISRSQASNEQDAAETSGGNNSNLEDESRARQRDMVNRNYFTDNWSNIHSKENTLHNSTKVDDSTVNIVEESEGQGQRSVTDETIQPPQKLLNNFEPNYNWNTHNKSINDKDVSIFCSPLPNQANVSSQSECQVLGNISPRCVPSSSMRACASQLYNCDTEAKVQKKDKKHYMQTRHSAGCFPVQRSSTEAKILMPEPKRSKVKGSARKRSSKVIGDGSNGVVKGSVTAVPNGRTGKGQPSSRKDYGFVDTPAHVRRTGNLVVNLADSDEAVSARYSLHSEPAMPVSLAEPTVQGRSPQNVSKSHSKGEHRRAKSLGKSEHVMQHTLDKSNRSKLDGHSSRKTHNRGKNCQSFPGNRAFHQELEHVLESQKQTIRTSVAKAMAGNSKSGSQCAVTQV